MAETDSSKTGTIWDDSELDLIVADYFEMLSAELSQQPYVKLRHSKALMAKIDRSHRSVEFKHQNISAVLNKLGLPWIPGYKPKENYQTAIFDAIDRHLTAHRRILELAPHPSPSAQSTEAVFVPQPKPLSNRGQVPQRLRQLVAKFDPVERDHRNRSLGKAGEEFTFELERKRLTDAGHPQLARQVRWTAAEDGDGAGYDISSFATTGEPRLIEVKTTNGSCRTPFFLSRNEVETSKRMADKWLIYRVHLFATTPKVFTVTPPLEHNLRLSVESWRACV
jgi:hypothetical protein